MPLNAGDLNRRVVITQRDSGVDAAGQPVTTWSTLATVWASVKAPAGKAQAERMSADRSTSVVAYSVRIRYRTDVTAAMRAEIAGQVYDIEQVVQDLAGREYTDLVCVAGAL